MLPDLQHLIELQRLDLEMEMCRRRITEIPAAQEALASRAAERQAAVQAVKERIAATGASRREVEKELAGVQSRLSKYKDQLMAVKTNKEYQAMQHEIATAEGLVRSHEDRLLDLMEASEQEAADLKSAEAAMKAEQAQIADEQRALDAEKTSRAAQLERLTSERATVAARIPAGVLAIFDRVAHGRKGIAVAEAKEGHCSVCHVRLRPQVFNDVRRNDAIIQCESCTRILFYVPPAAAAPAAQH
jgi:predicted  nucleic acid-binding Zn-ribbon protein